MFKLCINNMELTKNVIRWGNSAGVLLPKEWVGNEAKIVLVDRTSQIKKEVFDILDSYLEDILGIYLVGSYARHEQEEDSDIDVIAISSRTKKDIKSGKYNLSIIPIESIKKTLKTNPIMIYPRLAEAKTILNHSLIEELKAVKITKSSFKEFIDKNNYSKKLFLKWLETSLGEKTAEVYRIYTYLRDEKKIKEKIEIKTAEI